MTLAEAKTFHSFLRPLFRKDWVVYAKRPFGGPEHVLHYLARYTHRVAISNHRLVEGTDNHVSFRWKYYAHRSKRRVMTLSHEEFLRRFLQHVLPRGFPRIRYFGLLANRRRTGLLPLCRTLLLMRTELASQTSTAVQVLWKCPRCQGPMRLVERLTANQLRQCQHSQVERLDS